MKLKFDINKIKSFFEKLFFSLAENVFLSCLALFLLALIIGGLMLSRTVFFLKLEKSDSIEPLKLEKEGYENILKIWEKEEKKNNEADGKAYKKLFYDPPSLATPDKGIIEE